jgi:hypothetical protein
VELPHILLDMIPSRQAIIVMARGLLSVILIVAQTPTTISLQGLGMSRTVVATRPSLAFSKSPLWAKLAWPGKDGRCNQERTKEPYTWDDGIEEFPRNSFMNHQPNKKPENEKQIKNRKKWKHEKNIHEKKGAHSLHEQRGKVAIRQPMAFDDESGSQPHTLFTFHQPQEIDRTEGTT